MIDNFVTRIAKRIENIATFASDEVFIIPSMGSDVRDKFDLQCQKFKMTRDL